MFASTVDQASIPKFYGKYSVMYYERMCAMDEERYNLFWGAFWAQFLHTSTHQATRVFGGRAPVGQPWHVVMPLPSTRATDRSLGTNRIYLSIDWKKLSLFHPLAGLLKFTDFPRGLWESWSFISKLDPSCLVGPLFKSGCSLGQPFPGSSTGATRRQEGLEAGWWQCQFSLESVRCADARGALLGE